MMTANKIVMMAVLVGIAIFVGVMLSGYGDCC
jgi:hypothetical protein